MLVDGFNHVAVLTNDTDRFVAFYEEVFGAEVLARPDTPPGMRLTLLKVGPVAEFNIFQLDGNEQVEHQVPMFGRGRLDHVGLQAASFEAFDQIRDELVARGYSDGFVTDFGPGCSLFFRDPDGLEAEVVVSNPDWKPGDPMHPPGTPSRRYHPE